jgi:hypothetical protein
MAAPLQHKQASLAGSDPQTFSFTSAVTAGSLLTVNFRHSTAITVAGVSDSVNGAWVKAADVAMGGYTQDCWYLKNAGAGATTVSVDLSGAASLQYELNEWAGRDASTPIDDCETGTLAGATAHSASAAATPTVAGGIALVTYGFAGAFTVDAAPAGYTTTGGDASYLKQYYKDLAGTDAEDPELTTVDAEDSGTILVILKVPVATAAPTVTTQAVSGIGATGGTLNGTITDTGGENADQRGFVIDLGTQADPGNVAPAASGYASAVWSSGSFGVGAFTVNQGGLASSTTHYVRAFAHNSAGYSYGAEVTFDTLAASGGAPRMLMMGVG